MEVVKTKIQRYNEYKDSDVEWLGKIPEHWEVKKFKFVLNQSKGLTITKQNLTSEGVFCVNYGEIHSKFGFELDTTKHKLKCVAEEYLNTDSNSLLNKGDFVFADTSEDIAGSGNFTHLRSDDKTFAGYHTVIARTKIEIESLFLAFVFDSTSFRNQIRKKVKGVKVYSITQSVLKETNVWIPPLPEQTKIAQFLDYKTTKINAAIAIKKQQINLLKERKQILIHKAVTQGLNPNVKLKDSGVEWIGEIPEHWEVKKLTYLTKFITCGLASTPTYVDSKIGKPFLSAQNVRPFKMNYKKFNHIPIRLHKQLTAKRKIEKGDLLLTRVGAGIGDIAIFNENIDCAVYVSLTHIRVLNSVYNSFIMYFLGSHGAKLMHEEGTVLAGGQGNLNVNNLRKYRFPLPPYQEQKEISTYIETASQKIETAIRLKQQEIAKLKEYKSSLINSVVTGKVKVC